jgi:NAD-reducing hydrogenase large subunit
MNMAVTDVAKTYLSNQKKITEAMLNHIEIAIRAYDPCLSCATHALGQMPLKVEIYNADNKLIDTASQFVANKN